MENVKEIEFLLFQNEQKMKLLRKEIKRYPSGSLSISKRGKYLTYSKVSQRQGKVIRRGIGKNRPMIHCLARKTYLNRDIARLEKEHAVLTKAWKELMHIGNDPKWSSLPRNFELLPLEYLHAPAGALRSCDCRADILQRGEPSGQSAVYPREASLYVRDMTPEEWGMRAYCRNDSFSEKKIHHTAAGTAVRSKSEASILECYEIKEILYHYDEVISIRGQFISPDVIAICEDGKLIYHEHCGLVEDAAYMEHHRRKMELYESVGIVPWDNLIVTYDRPGGGIDLRLVYAEIESKFGR